MAERTDGSANRVRPAAGLLLGGVLRLCCCCCCRSASACGVRAAGTHADPLHGASTRLNACTLPSTTHPACTAVDVRSRRRSRRTCNQGAELWSYSCFGRVRGVMPRGCLVSRVFFAQAPPIMCVSADVVLHLLLYRLDSKDCTHTGHLWVLALTCSSFCALVRQYLAGHRYFKTPLRSFLLRVETAYWLLTSGLRLPPPVTLDLCSLAAQNVVQADATKVLRLLRRHGVPWTAKTTAEASSRGLSLLQWLRDPKHKRRGVCPLDYEAFEFAIVAGRTDVMKWLWEYGAEIHYKRAWKTAAEKGNVTILTWLADRAQTIVMDSIRLLKMEITECASHSCNVDAVRWIEGKGVYSYSPVCFVEAGKAGNFEMFEVLMQATRQAADPSVDLMPRILYSLLFGACMSGVMSILRASIKKCDSSYDYFTDRPTTYALRWVLVYQWTPTATEGVERVITLFEKITEFGSTEMLDLLYETISSRDAGLLRDVEAALRREDNVLRRAMSRGDAGMVQWCLSKGSVLTAQCMCEAAAQGHLHLLVELNNHTSSLLHPWFFRSPEYVGTVGCAAIEGGHLNVLQWLYDRWSHHHKRTVFPWIPLPCIQRTQWWNFYVSASVKPVHEQCALRVCKWLAQKGCPVPDDDTATFCCHAMAAHGMINLLQWMIDQKFQPGIPQNHLNVVHGLAKYGDLGLLMNAIENRQFGINDAMIQECVKRFLPELPAYDTIVQWLFRRSVTSDTICNIAFGEKCVYYAWCTAARLDDVEWFKELYSNGMCIHNEKDFRSVVANAGLMGNIRALQWLLDKQFQMYLFDPSKRRMSNNVKSLLESAVGNNDGQFETLDFLMDHWRFEWRHKESIRKYLWNTYQRRYKRACQWIKTQHLEIAQTSSA